MKHPRPAFSLLLSLLALPALAADAGFAVLRIARGDDVTFKVVAGDRASEEKKALESESRKALADHAAAEAAFKKEKANRGREFLEPKPEEAKVAVAKTFPTQAEAQAFAEAEQKKAEGKYAVVQVKDPAGAVSFRAVRQNKIRSLEAELMQDYAKRMDEWNAAKKAYYENTVAIGGPKPPFDKPSPSKPEVKKLKDNLATQEEADALASEFSAKKRR